MEAIEVSTVMEDLLPPPIHAELPPDRFLDRELSWLAFNNRVLDLAKDADRVPLLERAKFLAIFSSNLDEFYMWSERRRVASSSPRSAGPEIGSSGASQLHRVC